MNSPFKMIIVAVLAVASTVWVSRFFDDVDEQAIAYSLDRGGDHMTERLERSDQRIKLDAEQREHLQRYWDSAKIIYEHQKDTLQERYSEEIDMVTQLMLAQVLDARDRIEDFDPSPSEVAHLVKKAKQAGIDAVEGEEFERYITGQWLKERMDD